MAHDGERNPRLARILRAAARRCGGISGDWKTCRRAAEGFAAGARGTGRFAAAGTSRPRDRGAERAGEDRHAPVGEGSAAHAIGAALPARNERIRRKAQGVDRAPASAR